MSELEGIKDFIKANKESIENMNKEMIARYGQAPLVWFTVDEAKGLLRRIPEFKENGDWQLPIERLKERIAKAEKDDDSN